MEKALSTKECEAPHIVAFTNGGVGLLCGLYIVCDNVYIEVDVKLGMMGALLNLIATYYIFDLEYPRMHAMILAILQTLVMEESYKNATSKGYKVLSKDLKLKLAELSKNEDDNDQDNLSNN